LIIPDAAPLADLLKPEPPPRDARVWVVEDLIHSDRPTAEEALEQLMGFLEMLRVGEFRMLFNEKQICSENKGLPTTPGLT